MKTPHLSLARPVTHGLALAALAAAALLTGCSMMPTYERPAAPIAAQWPDASTATKNQASTPAADLAWQDFVGDTPLRELIRLALANNRDLRVAVLNMEQVRAAYQIRRADQFPTLNLAATGLRQPSTNGSGGISSVYTAGLAMASWEIDFFGRVASLKESALAQYLASDEARQAAQTSLIAAVANTWLSLQTNDELLALTQRTLVTRDDSLRLTKLRLDNGAASALDFRQAESLTAQARATLAQQRRLRALDVNALTLLVGQPLPDTLLATSATAPVFRDMPAGLPSDLLTRRPDIRQAEQQLIAANASIGAARAAFFPRISLTASAGSASSELSGLFKNGSWGWTLAPQALLPIFDAGRNQANLDASNAGRDIAVAQYEKAIQSAFREVADALAGRATLDEQVQAQQVQLDAEADRFRLADLRYRNGVASYLDILDAQRSLFAIQQGVAQTKLAYLQNQVTLYKALGGGASDREAAEKSALQKKEARP
ncbi:efflux transporter outer membrane subunit [Rhodoferax ferrireducens]|uniref:efflux transporter outer membrane subunit n=1 Tax=Rhodoferax ferrireducens TaxID=192843 RepID=UPI00298E2741|nr:efflux transporter outer membrane subunit [Rhodoferax ferrireducens]WPC68910.1 efflux transporter outer membrane subunit [Rhodoferax ferrireducens]